MSRGSLVSTPESWPGEGEGGEMGRVAGERGEGRRSISLDENTSSRSVISSESLRSVVSMT